MDYFENSCPELIHNPNVVGEMMKQVDLTMLVLVNYNLLVSNALSYNSCL